MNTNQLITRPAGEPPALRSAIRLFKSRSLSTRAALVCLAIPAGTLHAATMTDAFATRPTVTGASATFTGNSTGATAELGEPNHDGTQRQTVWGAWTAPSNGSVIMDTSGSGFDTVLAVYVGNTLTNLYPVARNRDITGSTWSQVAFPTKAGVTYAIAVDGQYANFSDYGNVILHLAWTANCLPGAVPGANSFARRGQLTGSNAEGVAMNWLFNTEAFEPDHGSSGHKTAWWEWTAPATGPVRIRTEGSDFDTYLVVYTGASLSSLHLVAANDNVSGEVWSDVTLQAQRGQGYLIMVDRRTLYTTASDCSNIRLRVDQAISPGETLAVYPAVEIELPGALGVRYQVQGSPNLIDWPDVGGIIQGTGTPIRLLQAARGTNNKFYRYQIVP